MTALSATAGAQSHVAQNTINPEVPNFSGEYDTPVAEFQVPPSRDG